MLNSFQQLVSLIFSDIILKLKISLLGFGKMMIDRRRFTQIAATSSVLSTTGLIQSAFSAEESFAWVGSDNLGGNIASTGDIDGMIAELNQTRAQIQLANDNALNTLSSTIYDGAVEAKTKTVELAAIDLKQANSDKLISTVGLAISGVSLGLLFVTAAPVWVIVGAGLVISATVPFALSLGAASKSQNLSDGVAVVSSFSAGRMSLIASGEAVSTAAKFSGRVFGAFAFCIDLVLAIRAWHNVNRIRDQITLLENETAALEAEASRMKSDPNYFRQTRLTQIDETISGLMYLKELTSIPRPTTPGSIILP
jgi:hypothetical protein